MTFNAFLDQQWDAYTAEEHALWRLLTAQQCTILQGRAVQVFIDGIDFLGISPTGIPKFNELNLKLMERTGWEVVAVPGLVPDELFFELLANRKFPSTTFLRTPAQIDYIQEPDIFHDIFGHIPLLAHPIFADYMQAYGRAGLKAIAAQHLEYLARLYWYTVEFGLIQTPDGLQIYGAGIVSSKGESVYCLESDVPNRIWLDAERIMKTEYIIDRYQDVYFVIESFDDLLQKTRKVFESDLTCLCLPETLTPTDVFVGDQAYR
ncbi:MAG: phenylalanine 4-monooxygenase [Alphaproteobacteria bacterium]|nr:phenylalanine 4-monooxygenase [Alphaproteobacteria bacterium]